MKTPRIEIGLLTASVDISEAGGVVGTTYRLKFWRPFYFSNDPDPILGGKVYRYTNTYEGEKFIHIIEGSPYPGTPYPFFKVDFEQEPNAKFSIDSVSFSDGTKPSLDSQDMLSGQEGNSATQVKVDGLTDEEPFSDESLTVPNGNDPITFEGEPLGSAGPFSAVDDILNGEENESGKSDEENTSSLNNEVSNTSYNTIGSNPNPEGTGTNPFYSREGWITLPSWFQWITWPLAVLADTLLDGFGLTAAGKNVILLIILALLAYVLFKRATNEKVVTVSDTRTPGKSQAEAQSQQTDRAEIFSRRSLGIA